MGEEGDVIIISDIFCGIYDATCQLMCVRPIFFPLLFLYHQNKYKKKIRNILTERVYMLLCVVSPLPFVEGQHFLLLCFNDRKFLCAYVCVCVYS